MIIIHLYAHLLRLYPREFYERFGTEMLEVFTTAWTNHRSQQSSQVAFCLHEFSGLLLSIAIEHGGVKGRSGVRMLFRRRFVPVWLLVFSLLGGVLLSLNYWGYVTVPASTISNLHTIDHIALVRFDEDYNLSTIPLKDMPHLITPDFPPSQILTAIPPHLDIDDSLDPSLAENLSAALVREALALGAVVEPRHDPVINPNNCGITCFSPGVQFQSDGTLLVIYPEIVVEGQVQGQSMTQQLTPNDWMYYSYITPAGYVVQGRDGHGSPLVFTAIASRMSGDRYRYQELTFTPGAEGLTLIHGLRYNFDVAGLEGMNVAMMTLLLFVPLFLLWGVILFISTIIGLLGGRQRRGRSIA